MKQPVEETNELTVIYSKPLKRTLCFILDIVLFLLLGFFFYGVGAQPIVTNMPTYKAYNETCEQAITTLNEMYTDSHLARYVVNTDSYDHEVALDIYLNAKLKNEDDKADETTSDIFVYFYTVYAPNHLTGPNGEKYNYTVEQVNKDIYGFDFQEDIIIWKLRDSSYSNTLQLTDEAITQIKRYKNNEIDSVSEKYYHTFKDKADTMLKDAAKILLNSKEYVEARESYNINSTYILAHYSCAAIILYTVLFAIYYLLIPLLVGNGKTLGKLLLGYSCFTVDRHPIKKKNVVLRAVLQYVTYFFVCTLFPFLQLGLNVFKMPVLIIGDYALTMIIPMLVSMLLAIVSFFVMLTSSTWQSLADLCSKTIVGKLENKPVDPVETESEK